MSGLAMSPRAGARTGGSSGMEQGLENLLQGELHLPATLHLQPSILSWVTNEDEVSPLLQGPSVSLTGACTGRILLPPWPHTAQALKDEQKEP